MNSESDWVGNRNSEQNGGSAFPIVSNGGYSEHQLVDEGMSLRDWFAGQALASGTLSDRQERFAEWWLKAHFGERDGIRGEEIMAARAYEIADAMLKERAK